MKYLYTLVALCLFSSCSFLSSNKENNFGIEGKAEWMFERLKDPMTNEIPAGIRKREIAFAENLPKDVQFQRRGASVWKQAGPFNIGGRTRGAAVDVTNDSILLAAGISGGVWRSTDQGNSWEHTTKDAFQFNGSCIAQDTREGKTNVWYLGTGENIGNSASANFSATYVGNGLFKSTDGGKSWSGLTSTQSNTTQSKEPWDIVWDIKTDPSDSVNDVVYAAILGRIMKSTNGGDSFRFVNGNKSGFLSAYTDVAVTSSGVVYSTLSSDGTTKGIFRSVDGEAWDNITPSNYPADYKRVVIAIDPNNENKVYFLGETPGAGKFSTPGDAFSEANSLWKYVYKSGNGTDTNNLWINLSNSIPADESFRKSYRCQGSYDVEIAVKPGDSNVVFIAGTNMFRSNDAFETSAQITHIGGYNPISSPDYRYPNHHPDHHQILFLSNPNEMLNTNDGGVYITRNDMASNVVWEDKNRGYFTTQFYTVGVNRTTSGNKEVIGGMQDNSSGFTRTVNNTVPWSIPASGDGSYCAIGASDDYYFSSQNGVTYKMELDQDGNRADFRRIDPENGSSYFFINPFILDDVDQNIMYMSQYTNIMRHNNLSSILLNNSGNKLSVGWERLVVNTAGERVSTLESTYGNPDHRLYIGTDDKKVYRLENADTAMGLPTEITQKVGTGSFVNDIAVHPFDGDKLILVYSNYNVYSLYYSKDAGSSWEKIAGNLEPELNGSYPPALDGIGDGPSVRSAAIVPVESGVIYFVGTSVGLFATKQLNGDSTVWVQQGTDVIGNAIVDMIDYRRSDGFIAIGTHGRGVFTAQIVLSSQVVGIDDIKNQHSEASKNTIKVYPNPASDYLRISAQGNSVKVYSLEGELVLSQKLASNLAEHKLDITNLKNGLYTFVVLDDNCSKTGKFVVNK